MRLLLHWHSYSGGRGGKLAVTCVSLFCVFLSLHFDLNFVFYWLDGQTLVLCMYIFKFLRIQWHQIFYLFIFKL